jgi:hypothetical protein
MTPSPHEVEIALLKKEVTDLRDDVHALTKEVTGLVDAWKTASGVVAFVKWTSSAVVALGILWTAVRIKIGG